MEVLDVLRDCELFGGLSKECISRYILPLGSMQIFSKGQFPILPHQRVEHLSVILSGKIHVMHVFPNGDYSLMSVLSPTKVLGMDLACTKSMVSPYHAVAAADTRVISFPVEMVTKPGMLPEAERLIVLDRLLKEIAQENMKKEYRLAILAQKGLRERILTYLTMQMSKRGSQTIVIPFSREELASFLCVNRTALSHELSLMRQEGLISFHKNTFTLHMDMYSALTVPDT